MVVRPGQKPEEWAFEMGSPGQLTTQGWKKDTVKVGDKISISFHPMRMDHGGCSRASKLYGTVMGGVRRPAIAPGPLRRAVGMKKK